MKLLIIDDDNEFSLILKNDLSRFLYQISEDLHIDIINQCFNGFYDFEGYDIIFIDIDLVDVDGISLSKTIKANSQAIIVFISSKSNLVHKSMEVHPFFFIRKGFYDKDLSTFFKLFNDTIEDKEMIFLKYKSEKIAVFLKNIIYIESKEHVMSFYMKNKVVYHDNRSLSLLSDVLPSTKFVRIHNAYIINLDYLNKYSNNKVILSNNSILPIGRKYKEQFNNQYMDYLLT